MQPKKRKIIVVGKVREFDEAVWKRLLMAYAYHLHEERMRQWPPVEAGEGDSPADRGDT